MFTHAPTSTPRCEVVLDDGTSTVTATVINVTDPLPQVGYKTLVIEGHHAGGHAQAGHWYRIKEGFGREAVQSGEWEQAATMPQTCALA
jgi:hypothetical protein